jgi:hypothetical protein
VPATRWRALLGSQLALVGLVALVASFLVRRRRAPVRTAALALVAIGAGVGLPPLVVDAYPTTYRRPLVTYHAGSIAAGMTTTRSAAPLPRRYGRRQRNDGAPHRSPRGLPHRAAGGRAFWLLTQGIPDAACRISGAVSVKRSAGT